MMKQLILKTHLKKPLKNTSKIVLLILMIWIMIIAMNKYKKEIVNILSPYKNSELYRQLSNSIEDLLNMPVDKKNMIDYLEKCTKNYSIFQTKELLTKLVSLRMESDYQLTKTIASK